MHADRDRALAQIAASRVAHAQLIIGIDGIGKRAFGQWFAEALLCDAVTATGACGVCGACRQLLADAHPDFCALHPEGAAMTIRIDAVRELLAFCQLTARQHSRRVALLVGADAMNRAAANALLKTLEEPGDDAVLILVADQPGALPATVRSRCQAITLRMQDRAAATDWLAAQFAGNETAGEAGTTASVERATQWLAHSAAGPFRALGEDNEEAMQAEVALRKAWTDLFLHRGSVGRITDSIAKLPARTCLSGFTRFTTEVMKIRAGVSIGADPAITEAMTSVQSCLSNEQWFTVHDRLLQLHRSDSASFKTQTVLEGLLADIRLMING